MINTSPPSIINTAHAPTTLTELDSVRQNFKVAYDRAKAEPDLLTENVVFIKPVNNGDYTVKLTVLFTPQTMPLPNGSPKSAKAEVVLSPTFTLYDWPKGQMAGDSTELDAVTVEDAYDAALGKLEGYSNSTKGKRAAQQADATPQPPTQPPTAAAQGELFAFGGDIPQGTTPEPLSVRAKQQLSMMAHLEYLCRTTRGNWFRFNKADAQRIPHLFNLPRGSTIKGAGPHCTMEAHGYRLERRVYVGKASRSYSYEYRLTQVADNPQPTKEAVLVASSPVPPPTKVSPPYIRRIGPRKGKTIVLLDAVPATAQPQQTPPDFKTLLETAEQAVQNLRSAYDQMEATFAKRLSDEIAKAQKAQDDYHKEQMVEAESNYNTLTDKLHQQIDKLTAKLTDAETKLQKKQKQLRALLDE